MLSFSEVWPPISLTLTLAATVTVILLVIGTPIAWWLARSKARWKEAVAAIVALPLVLPPTVLGFYLLVAFGARSPLGQWFAALTGQSLAFSFEGLLLASIVVNVPFAVQPIQRAFESIPVDVREAAACCGMPPWRAWLAVELPLAWPGIVTAAVLTFAHTLGEFGVVLMVGGNIPSQTRTLSIAIYDRMQAFDNRGAAVMAATLLAIALVTLVVTNVMSRRIGRRHA